MKRQRGKEARGKKRRKEEFFPVIFASCFLFFYFFCGGCSRPAARTLNQVCFGDKCVKVEVVRKEEEVHRGLMFRRSLNADRGMLFVFKESGPYAFWMKNTLIPLDMIWLDETRKVVHIEENVPPCKADPCPRYPPGQPALYVLEVNAGYAQKLGLQLGDMAEFRLNSF